MANRLGFAFGVRFASLWFAHFSFVHFDSFRLIFNLQCGRKIVLTNPFKVAAHVEPSQANANESSVLDFILYKLYFRSTKQFSTFINSVYILAVCPNSFAHSLIVLVVRSRSPAYANIDTHTRTLSHPLSLSLSLCWPL